MTGNTHAPCNEGWCSTSELSIGDESLSPGACTQTPTWKKDVAGELKDFLRCASQRISWTTSSVLPNCLFFSFLFFWKTQLRTHLSLWNQLCKTLPNNKSLEWILKKIANDARGGLSQTCGTRRRLVSCASPLIWDQDEASSHFTWRNTCQKLAVGFSV